MISHGRHPAEWDCVQLTWHSEHAPAAPFFSYLDNATRPERARETICELLACGLPIARDAHVKELNNALSRKQFVKRGKRVLNALRQHTNAAVHLAVASEQAVLAPQHAEFLGSAQTAIKAAPVLSRAAALAEVVRIPAVKLVSVSSALAGVR